MSSLYSLKDSNITKTWGLMGIFFVVVIFVGWVFAQAYQSSAILYGAVLLSLLMNVTSYWYSDTIALAVSGAKSVSREEYFDLYTVTENLCITAGIPMPKVYVINDPAPNAFATGRNPKHASIAVTSGLLESLSRVELEGVVAHELAHIKNYDILLSTAVVVLVGFLSLLSDFFLRSMRFRGRDNDRGNVIFLMVGIVLAILSPIAGVIIQLAISRKREFVADATGALLTRYPEGLASALEKISSYTSTMRITHRATAHLFISSPLGGISKNTTGWFSRLFMTHPPIEDRIAALRGIEK
jgi:heat shock protein HtpX